MNKISKKSVVTHAKGVITTSHGKGLAISSWTSEEKAYLAGFLDGDGSIILQIIRAKEYRYGFYIRISLSLFQKTSRNWFLMSLKKDLGNIGSLRNRGDNVSEYTISGEKVLKEVLENLLPYLKIKKLLAQLALTIVDKNQRVQSQDDFLEVCKLVDKAVHYTDSKRRTITAAVVEEFFHQKSFLKHLPTNIAE